MKSEYFIGGGGDDYAVKQGLGLKYANRHGLIAGATGTVKPLRFKSLPKGFPMLAFPYSYRL